MGKRNKHLHENPTETPEVAKIYTIDADKAESLKTPEKIIPGTKVKVKGKSGVFSVSQILANGKISLLVPNGTVLFIGPEDIINI